MVHLGLGAFFQAHQAWYTHTAADAEEWGYAAFGGRSSGRSTVLAEQGGRYTLVVRGPGGDVHQVIGSVVSAHAAADVDAWDRCFTDPAVAVVTSTVTEAGYLMGASGGADLDSPALRSDVDLLRRTVGREGGGSPGEARPVTAPARLVAGLVARRRVDAGPITLVPCDNLSTNGETLRRVLVDVAEAVDPALVDWIGSSVSVVSTVVDRITPRTTDLDRESFRDETGTDDRSLVITEPFHEWILSGAFGAGRPAWESGGARFVHDVEAFERRKLWLLNGAHSLLAYAGSILGHDTVAAAMSDDVVVGWVEEWWDEASRHLDLPAPDLAGYRAALHQRFTNPRIAHHLAQIAADGSQKIPVRILPTMRAERTAGRSGTGAARVIAAWLCHLRGRGAPVSDPRAAALTELAGGQLEAAARRVLAELDPVLAGDEVSVTTVVDCAEELSSDRHRG